MYCKTGQWIIYTSLSQGNIFLASKETNEKLDKFYNDYIQEASKEESAAKFTEMNFPAYGKSSATETIQQMTSEQTEVYDANGDLISTTKRKRSRHIPPNIGAVCFILKNQKPEKWQDKPERIQNDTVADDGFIEALKGSAAEDWQDDDAADEELESGDLLNEKE